MRNDFENELEGEALHLALRHVRVEAKIDRDPLPAACGFHLTFYKSQFPHKSVNLFLISVMINDTLTDLRGN